MTDQRKIKDRVPQVIAGTTAAQLINCGIKVICKLDFAFLALLYKKLDPEYQVVECAIAHLETKWVKENLY